MFGRNFVMERIISPIGFPLVLLVVFWFNERNKSPEHKADRARMRFWTALCALIACGEYAVAWHNEIGIAWQNHPELTLFSTLVVFAVIFAMTRPFPDFTKKF